MAQEETGAARAAARGSASKTGNGGTAAGKTGQADAADLTLAVATALGEQMSRIVGEVLAEQRGLFAEQAALREADYVLVRQVVEEQRARQASDAMLLDRIDKQAGSRHREHYSPAPGSARPGQLRLGLQFHALSNVLGSRKRTGADRDYSLIPAPEIERVDDRGRTRYLMRFVAALPPMAETVLVRFLDGTTGGDRVENLVDNSLEIASDQVQAVELLDSHDQPIAIGIPYRG
ncbi:hypothetical protein [Arthrobacter sp. C152]